METPERQPSGWAVGWTIFAAFMMIMLGSLHAIAGLAGVLEDEFIATIPAIGTETTGDVYFLQLDATTWGWIHLIGGVLVLLAGFALFGGAVWARSVGVILAVVSALIGFAWIPYYPVWGVVIVAVATTVIWALTVHGRDISA